MSSGMENSGESTSKTVRPGSARAASRSSSLKSASNPSRFHDSLHFCTSHIPVMFLRNLTVFSAPISFVKFSESDSAFAIGESSSRPASDHVPLFTYAGLRSTDGVATTADAVS